MIFNILFVTKGMKARIPEYQIGDEEKISFLSSVTSSVYIIIPNIKYRMSKTVENSLINDFLKSFVIF